VGEAVALEEVLDDLLLVDERVEDNDEDTVEDNVEDFELEALVVDFDEEVPELVFTDDEEELFDVEVPLLEVLEVLVL
jgi:hypothetical protein